MGNLFNSIGRADFNESSTDDPTSAPAVPHPDAAQLSQVAQFLKSKKPKQKKVKPNPALTAMIARGRKARVG